MRLKGLAELLALASLLNTSCGNLRSDGSVAKDEPASFEDTSVKAAPKPAPSPHGNVTEFREQSQSSTPDKIHGNWKIYHINGYIYGRSTAEPDQEFLTRKIETPPEKIILIGQSLVIVQPLTSAHTFKIPPGSRTTLKEGKIDIRSGKQRSKICIPTG